MKRIITYLSLILISLVVGAYTFLMQPSRIQNACGNNEIIDTYGRHLSQETWQKLLKTYPKLEETLVYKSASADSMYCSGTCDDGSCYLDSLVVEGLPVVYGCFGCLSGCTLHLPDNKK